MGRNAVGSPAKLEYKSISTDVTSPQRSVVNPTTEEYAVSLEVEDCQHPQAREVRDESS